MNKIEVKIILTLIVMSAVTHPITNQYIMEAMFWVAQWAFVPVGVLMLYLTFLFGKYYNRSERVKIPKGKTSKAGKFVEV